MAVPEDLGSVPEQDDDLNNGGLGQRLRKAREACSLDISLAAEQLNLRVATLEALENERFTDLPAPVFVKGYLRNYARLLNLPADPFLQAYSNHLPDTIPNTLPPCVHGRPKSKYGLALRIIGYFLLAGTLLVLLWWQELPGLVEELASSIGISVQQDDKASLPSAPKPVPPIGTQP